MHHAVTTSDDNINSQSASRSPAAELPTTVAQEDTAVIQTRNRVGSTSSNAYYEDIDPRFAAETDPVPPLPTMHDQQNDDQLMSGPDNQYGPVRHPTPLHLPQSSYEDLPGARSPAESETSNFTSISQRGVNPNWRPGQGYGGEFNSLAPLRNPQRQQQQQQQQRQDMLLSGNADFEIPGMSATRSPYAGRGRGALTARGGGYGAGYASGRMIPASVVGSGSDGRYPGPMMG